MSETSNQPEEKTNEANATEFLTHYNQYDPTKTISQINDLEAELLDEVKLKEQLGNPNGIKQDVETFHASYGNIIHNQAKQVRQLTADLQKLVLANNVTIAQSEEVVDLLTSTPYQKLTTDIESIDQDIASAQEFLRQHHRVGRKTPHFKRLS